MLNIGEVNDVLMLIIDIWKTLYVGAGYNNFHNFQVYLVVFLHISVSLPCTAAGATDGHNSHFKSSK
jgi:hypothetical protein